MAQKFTVDPKLLQGTTQVAKGTKVESDDEDEDVNEDSDKDELTPEQKRVMDRKALMDRLAKEYEESVKEAKEEGCAMCSS
jgi:hypothetical protein